MGRVTAATTRSTASSPDAALSLLSDVSPESPWRFAPTSRGTGYAVYRYLTSETALIPLSLVPMEHERRHPATNHRERTAGPPSGASGVLARIVMAALGVVLGFVIGGIGIAIMGTAIGIPAFVVMLVIGWLGWRVGRRLDRWLSQRRGG